MQDPVKLTPIKLTKPAHDHIKSHLTNDTFGFRLGLKDYGCSGFAYTMDLVTEPGADDQVFDVDGINILIANEHFRALKGVTIDLVQDGPHTELQVNNPNVKHKCGCGESFEFEDEDEESAEEA